MPDPDQYAAGQAAALRDDWQFSRIFADQRARPGFTALLALRAELAHVIAQNAESGIRAMKFEWWRGEIERGFAGNAQHPLARALGTHLHAAGIAPEYVVELVDAAETESESGTFSEQDFQLYLYRSGGVLAEMLAQLSGASDRSALNAARRIGQVKRFSELLLATGAMLRAERWLFPANWLDARTMTLRDVLKKDDGTGALLDTMLAALDRERITARTAMEHAEPSPALALQWALAQRDHERMRNHPSIMLAPQPVKDGMLARLWAAWRAARRAVSNRTETVRG